MHTKKSPNKISRKKRTSAVRADVEIGGTDQRFNLLAGRDIQRLYRQEPQDILTNPLVAGLDGRKMISSYGNTVNLIDSPEDMFGKIMSIKDEYIIPYFTLVTRVATSAIEEYRVDMVDGKNPRDFKMALAHEIVRMYHSQEIASKATTTFVNTFSKKETPRDRPKFRPSKYDIVTILVEAELVSSKTDARRIVAQGGVKIDRHVVTDSSQVVFPGAIVQKGKIQFLEIE